MAENSKIEWTKHSLSIFWGCCAVHIGCDNCYACAFSKRTGRDLWGNDNPRMLVKSAWLDIPRKVTPLFLAKLTHHS